jgi:hypothetical protein
MHRLAIGDKIIKPTVGKEWRVPQPALTVVAKEAIRVTTSARCRHSIVNVPLEIRKRILKPDPNEEVRTK